jgi:hypothetical protein
VFLQDELQSERSGVYFHEREDIARLWGRRRGCIMYAGDTDELELERHPEWVGVWVSKSPVPFNKLEVVDWREGEPGIHDLPERINARAMAWGTL